MDVTLRATSVDGVNDVRLYVVESGYTPPIPVVVNVYLTPIGRVPIPKVTYVSTTW